MYEDTSSTRKYTFLAYKAGKDTVRFCFAHRCTLNFATKDLEIEVEAAPSADRQLRLDPVSKDGKFGTLEDAIPGADPQKNSR